VVDFAVNPDVGLWQINAVLNGQNSYYVTDEVEGTLSIKSIVSGEGSWVTPSARYRLDPSSYLVLNHGQRYRVDIQSNELVETFCIFFKPGFVDRVRHGAKQSWDGLLQMENDKGSGSEFYERLNPADDLVSPQLSALRNIVRCGQASELEPNEAMMRIAQALLRSQTNATIQRESLDATKESTREEIYRRLCIARDFMIANVDKRADLNAIASAACLSPFHFHRLFKSGFGKTPHEFLCEIRLAKAKLLLKSTGLTMTEIAWRIGFESQAAFTKFFSKCAGIPPTAFRAQA
jgi:AraC family transcriptional regulator